MSAIDALMLPLYVILVYAIAYAVKLKWGRDNPAYKYLYWGLTAKMVGGVSLCLIYVYYYGGGDTIVYFDSVKALNNLAQIDFSAYIDIQVLGETNRQTYASFTEETGYQEYYIFADPRTYSVVRIASLFAWLGGNQFMVLSLILAAVSFIGIWKVFLAFSELFPTLRKHFAIAFLFMPSCIFWGSGLLKDTFTFSATCWIVYAMINLLYRRRKYLMNIVILIVAGYILLLIKPYILAALIPTCVLWVTFKFRTQIKNRFLRITVTPTILVLMMGAGFGLLNFFGDSLGKFSLDNVIESARITQADLIRDQYGANSFNIGTFDGSLSSLAAKAPLAIIAAFYRPFMWEARNPVMLLSALENLFLIIMTFNILFWGRFRTAFTVLKHQPLMIFCITFVLLFGFSIGLSTANFGALVRYKIPLIPFLMCYLFILRESFIVSKWAGKQAVVDYFGKGIVPNIRSNKFKRFQQVIHERSRTKHRQ